VHIVPNGVDTTYFVPSSSQTERGVLLFTGRMSYEPNADAVCYFAEQVLPLVRRECPQARLHIVGAAPPPRVSALASNAVVVHGQVADIRPYFATAEAVVVPIRTGGGTRLKLLEAAASGKAIVSTSLGAEGLAFAAGRDLLIADAPATFAAAIVAVLGDGALRDTLGSHARARARQYDWAAIGEGFRHIMATVYSRVARGRY
jgi:polysaccharide biosynthesis protein PslH